MTTDMAAFDRLPAAVRAALNDCPFHFQAATVAELRRAHRLDVAETVRLIGAMEDWAREQLALRSHRPVSNRLQPSAAPSIPALIAKARAQ